MTVIHLIKKSVNFVVQDKSSLFIFIYVLLSISIWAIFYPALMSTDSIYHYQDAVNGFYNDFHPPLLPITLSGILSIGFDIGFLMLIQCVAGSLGIRILSISVQKSFMDNQLSSTEMELIALTTFGILLIPVSPLIFYLMTFWKDAWLAIFLIWAFALSIHLYNEADTSQNLIFYPEFFILAFIIALAALTRHNAVVILFSLCIATWMIMRRRNIGGAYLLALSPLVFYFILNQVQYDYFNVARTHPGKYIMALDLVGLCVESQNICDELPNLKKHLRKDYRYRYVSGYVGPIFWESPTIIDHEYFREENRPKIIEEYKFAIMKYPQTLVKVKIKAFWSLLGIREKLRIFYPGIKKNTFGLSLNHRFENIRDKLIRAGIKLSKHKFLRFISCVPLVWIFINLLWALGVMILYNKNRNPKYLFYLTLLGTTIIYYGSYLLATPDHAYRFTYPSTLIIQILTVSTILVFFFRLMKFHAKGTPET